MLRSALLLLLMLAILPAPGRAYETVPAADYPGAGHLSGAFAERTLFPDFDPAVLRAADYMETSSGGAIAGFITLRVSEAASVALLHYTPAGECRILRWGQPLEARQNTTLTFTLPARGGLTRLLVSRRDLDRAALLHLAQHPNHTTTPVPGVLAQRWFTRERAGALAVVPWEDPLARFGLPPRLGLREWPLASARLGADLRAMTKDCSVSYSGVERFAIEEGATQASWTLGTLEELTLQVELPRRRSPARVTLLLDAPGEAVEVRVNGAPAWLGTSSLWLSYGSEIRGVWDIGGQLRPGRNTLVLRGAAFAAETPVSVIELWEE